jgi:hypothetical protein
MIGADKDEVCWMLPIAFIILVDQNDGERTSLDLDSSCLIVGDIQLVGKRHLGLP